MAKVPHDPNEILAVVDEKDNPVGRAPRKEIHALVRFHRHASVLLLNRAGQILLQKRNGDGKIDYSASGHFPYDMDYLEAAVKETEEELGLRIDKSRFTEVLKVRDPSDGPTGVFVCLFEVKGDYRIDEMKIDPFEVDSVRYYSIDEIKGIISTSESQGFCRIMGMYLEKTGL